MFWGNALWVFLQHSYLYLLHYIIVHAYKEIHRWFFWKKSAQDTVSFEKLWQYLFSSEEKMVYMILSVHVL